MLKILQRGHMVKALWCDAMFTDRALEITPLLQSTQNLNKDKSTQSHVDFYIVNFHIQVT